jgi:argininosuccinate lyase
VLAGMLDTLRVDRARMRVAAAEGFTTATSVADILVRNGVPFRAAHHIVGALVARAEAGATGLDAVDDGTFRAALAASDDPVARRLAEDASIPATLRAAADIDAALASCDVIGGTAPDRVRAALAEARARLDRES